MVSVVVPSLALRELAIHLHKLTCMQLYMYMCVYVYMCICVYAYTKYTHTLLIVVFADDRALSRKMTSKDAYDALICLFPQKSH